MRGISESECGPQPRVSLGCNAAFSKMIFPRPLFDLDVLPPRKYSWRATLNQLLRVNGSLIKPKMQMGALVVELLPSGSYVCSRRRGLWHECLTTTFMQPRFLCGNSKPIGSQGECERSRTQSECSAQHNCLLYDCFEGQIIWRV